METSYGQELAKQQFTGATRSGPGLLGQVSEVKVFDRCVAEAGTIREQIAEASKVADQLLSRLVGPRPESDSAEINSKEALNGGFIGELGRIQSSSINYLADLRRTLEQIGKYV